MAEEKSIGILLQTIPYLGTGKILKVFSREAGLLSFFTKKKTLGSLASPFCIGEWVYKRGESDLYSLKDASLIDPLLELRKTFATISAAGAIAQDILRSQLPEQKTEPLYDLLVSYFKKISEFAHPELLSISFRLKLLLHEGLLSLKTHCAHCSEKAFHLSRGESFCSNHASSFTLSFTPLEWSQLNQLAFASKFSVLQELEISASFIEKSSLLLDSSSR